MNVITRYDAQIGTRPEALEFVLTLFAMDLRWINRGRCTAGTSAKTTEKPVCYVIP